MMKIWWNSIMMSLQRLTSLWALIGVIRLPTDGAIPTIPGTPVGMIPGRWLITALGMPDGMTPSSTGTHLIITIITGTVLRCGDGPIGARVGATITTGLPGMTTCVTGQAPIAAAVVAAATLTTMVREAPVVV